MAFSDRTASRIFKVPKIFVVNVSTGPEVIENNGLYFTDNKLKAMRDYVGTHHLTIHLKGDLVNLFNTEFLTSDSLSILSGYLDSDDLSMVKDRHYYENIGKYDQFVGGWSDVSTSWYWEEKDVGDRDRKSVV